MGILCVRVLLTLFPIKDLTWAYPTGNLIISIFRFLFLLGWSDSSENALLSEEGKAVVGTQGQRHVNILSCSLLSRSHLYSQQDLLSSPETFCFILSKYWTSISFQGPGSSCPIAETWGGDLGLHLLLKLICNHFSWFYKFPEVPYAANSLVSWGFYYVNQVAFWFLLMPMKNSIFSAELHHLPLTICFPVPQILLLLSLWVDAFLKCFLLKCNIKTENCIYPKSRSQSMFKNGTQSCNQYPHHKTEHDQDPRRPL